MRGALLRHYLNSGAILTAGDVLHPRERGFLAAVLAPGARAISVGVDAVTGNGGLIWPGDRVDMILTQQLDEKDAPIAKRFVGETELPMSPAVVSTAVTSLLPSPMVARRLHLACGLSKARTPVT